MPVIDLGSVVGPQGPQGATGATGAQGIQGNPGPNQVTDQTSTNLNGVLFGNQSRVTGKPIDSDPTADSTNPVSSGGTKAALDTKASQGQLAYVENGTTATKPNGYAVGEYFCWHGSLYKAKTAIGNGDTFTVNTNCEQVTDGVANSLANQIIIESLALPNTGSVSPNTNAIVSTTIPTKTGYAPVACVPGYSGDDQFCWVACALTSNSTQVSATVRNVSSASDSGAPRVFIIYQKV